MEQSPSWEANRSSDGQEIPPIVWNLTAFTNTYHLSPSSARSIQTISLHATSEDPFQYYPPIYTQVFQMVSFP